MVTNNFLSNIQPYRYKKIDKDFCIKYERERNADRNTNACYLSVRCGELTFVNNGMDLLCALLECDAEGTIIKEGCSDRLIVLYVSLNHKRLCKNWAFCADLSMVNVNDRFVKLMSLIYDVKPNIVFVDEIEDFTANPNDVFAYYLVDDLYRLARLFECAIIIKTETDYTERSVKNMYLECAKLLGDPNYSSTKI